MSSASSPNDMRQMTSLGRKIENDSFAVIDHEVGEHGHAAEEWEVVRRVIHATADFELSDLLAFSPNAIQDGIAALRGGCAVVADVKMITAGLSAERLGSYGCRMYEYISDPDVIDIAKANHSTRAIEAMRKAQREGVLNGAIVAVGNAPTALLEILRLCKEEAVRPALVIGVPVGFVSAAESKDALIKEASVPYIAIRGRKGGSTIAVSIIHALLKLSVESGVKK